MNKNDSFQHRRIVITGASDGIGAEMARQLAQEGARLVLAARNAEALARIAADCEQAGGESLVVPTDVSDPAQCQALIDAAVAHFGGLDALVNNAGISMHARFENTTDLTTYERLFRVNVQGAIWCSHAALPHLRESRGQLVAMSSLLGLIGLPGRTAYCTSKFAMTGFFEALRLELAGTGVDVTTLFPGVVATGIRVHGLDGDGRIAGRSGLKEEGAMPVDECVRQCLAAMRRRRPRLVLTARARVGLVLKSFWPSFVDRLAGRAVKSDAP